MIVLWIITGVLIVGICYLGLKDLDAHLEAVFEDMNNRHQPDEHDK
jgi:hypothetical protein